MVQIEIWNWISLHCIQILYLFLCIGNTLLRAYFTQLVTLHMLHSSICYHRWRLGHVGIPWQTSLWSHQWHNCFIEILYWLNPILSWKKIWLLLYWWLIKLLFNQQLFKISLLEWNRYRWLGFGLLQLWKNLHLGCPCFITLINIKTDIEIGLIRLLIKSY